MTGPARARPYAAARPFASEAGRRDSPPPRAGGRGRGIALPRLLFLERAALEEPVTVEVDRPGAVHPQVTGFWRGQTFHRVLKVVETRYEYSATYVRAVTEDGAVDLRRRQVRDPRTMRTTSAWELCAELDAIEIPRLP